jgi:hypothetical protein
VIENELLLFSNGKVVLSQIIIWKLKFGVRSVFGKVVGYRVIDQDKETPRIKKKTNLKV